MSSTEVVPGTSSKPTTVKKPTGPSQEQIVAGFNQLRQEQRTISSKVAELESDLNEHTLVLDALKNVEGSRKCFRLVGGVLVERTVSEVAPSLEKNKDSLSKLIDSLKEQIVLKGREINEFMEKNNIQIRNESNENQVKPESGSGDEAKGSSGVLVASP